MNNRSITLAAALVLLLAFFLRAATLESISLIDPSESRFATASHQMVETGSYLMPQLPKDGVWRPFWSKPPLFYWAGAASMKIFGMSNWAARIPSFLSAVGLTFLVMLLALEWFGASIALVAGIALISSVGFFFFSGTCLSDTLLAACTTGAVVSFALQITGSKYVPRRILGLGFFLFCALGTLTKGPVALIFIGAIIALYCILSRTIRPCLSLPWVTGMSLFLAVATPWFLLAEQANPGYLKYFLLNENALRYLSSDYGDLYGHPHTFPYGFVWLMLLAACFPWSLVLLAAAWTARTALSFRALRADGKVSFLLAWALAPALLLTFSRNLQPTYLIPAFGGIALLTARLVCEWAAASRALARYLAAIGVLFAAGVLGLSFFGVWYEPNLVPRLALIGACAFVFAIFRVRSKQQALASAFLRTAATAVLLFFSVYLSLGTVVSERRSSELALEYVRSLDMQPKRVGVLYNNPLSAYYYNGDEALSLLSITDDAVAAGLPIDLLLVKKKSYKKLPQSFFQHFILERKVGIWMVLRRVAAAEG